MALFDHALFNEDRLIGEVMIPIELLLRPALSDDGDQVSRSLCAVLLSFIGMKRSLLDDRLLLP